MPAEGLSWVLVGAGVAVFGLVELILVFAMVRRVHRPGQQPAWLEEGTWMVLPVALLMVLLFVVQTKGQGRTEPDSSTPSSRLAGSAARELE